MKANASASSGVYTPPKQGYFTRLRRNVRAYLSLYLLIIPVIAFYLLFKYVPMLGNIIAFENYRPARGFLGSKWVGLRNFKDFLSGPFAGRTIRNTIEISLLQLAFGFPAPIILAILVNELRPGLYKKTVQTVSYLPYFISLVVVCGMVKNFTVTSGLFNDVRALMGMERINMLTDVRYYRTLYVGSSIWQSCGWGSILYLATITNADPQLYEAATMDGAGRFAKMWHITLPTLIPIIVVQLVMRVGHIMSMGSERTILLYSPVVYDKADIISSFVYRYGLQELNFSYGAAVDLFNSVVNLILLVLVNKAADALTGESLW